MGGCVTQRLFYYQFSGVGGFSGGMRTLNVILVIIHADHVVQSAWILFSLWMYVCMYVSALERKRLIGMT